jgi:hypothetical protein
MRPREERIDVAGERDAADGVELKARDSDLLPNATADPAFFLKDPAETDTENERHGALAPGGKGEA